MIILERGKHNEITCECGTKLRYEPNDLKWTHNEPDCYYVTCPVCGRNHFIDSTPELDEEYTYANHPKYNPYNLPL